MEGSSGGVCPLPTPCMRATLTVRSESLGLHPGEAWSSSRMEMPPPLWARYCCPILMEQSGFHLSRQRCLLALDLSPGTSEKGSAFPVYLSGSGRCICGPAGRLSGLKKSSSLSLPLYAMRSMQLGGCCQAAACHHFSHTREPDCAQCSMYSLSSAQWWGTHPWG